jgi:hypothetical protein
MYISCQSKSDKLPLSTYTLHFEHTFGNESFSLDKRFVTLNQDTVDFTRFEYYISNIQLILQDGSIWREQESYHLVRVDQAVGNRFTIQIDSVPARQIAELRFAVGVDSVRNSSGAQVGALDPLNGMFWTWRTGYIFFKSEGFYYQGSFKGGLVYHIGTQAAYTPLQFKTSANQQKEATIRVDARQLFGGFPGAAIVLKVPADRSSISVMGGDRVPLIARNIRQMFVLKAEN